MNYEINYDTQIIIPIGRKSSKIIESEDEYFIKNDTMSILEHSCEYFGSSFEGRKEGTKKYLPFLFNILLKPFFPFHVQNNSAS